MRNLLILLFTFSQFAYSQENKSQLFSDYSESFKVQSVDFSNYVVSFSGRVKAAGEIIFELVQDEGYEGEIYKVSFIPNDVQIFPAIASGFYPKKLEKLDLINHELAKKLLFSTAEWEKAISARKRFISKSGIVEVESYATSVECDSRQYYAKIVSFSVPSLKVSYADERSEMAGC